MNTASQDLKHHLKVLRERMEDPTEYERAIHYFLEEFAGDEKFIAQSESDEAPHLVTVLQHVASKAAGQPVTFDAARVMHLAEHKFFHGNAVTGARIVLFFYFQETNTGVIALVPGAKGGTDVVRFQMPGGLADPRKN